MAHTPWRQGSDLAPRPMTASAAGRGRLGTCAARTGCPCCICTRPAAAALGTAKSGPGATGRLSIPGGCLGMMPSSSTPGRSVCIVWKDGLRDMLCSLCKPSSGTAVRPRASMLATRKRCRPVSVVGSLPSIFPCEHLRGLSTLQDLLVGGPMVLGRLAVKPALSHRSSRSLISHGSSRKAVCAMGALSLLLSSTWNRFLIPH